MSLVTRITSRVRCGRASCLSQLCLGRIASDEVAWHECQPGCDVVELSGSVEELVDDVGVTLFVMKEEYEVQCQVTRKTEKDPDGGLWPVHPTALG